MEHLRTEISAAEREGLSEVKTCEKVWKSLDTDTKDIVCSWDLIEYRRRLDEMDAYFHISFYIRNQGRKAKDLS